MSAAYSPSEHVADEASALVDELWRAMGRSDEDPHDDTHHDTHDGARRRGGGGTRAQTLCPLCALRGRGGFDPAAVERLADVVESAAVGLRAFAAHLATLRSADGTSPSRMPAEASACACEDSDQETREAY